MLGYLWLIPILCLAGALLNLLLGLLNARKSVVNFVGLAASGGAMVRLLAPGSTALKTLPSAKRISSAVPA